MKEIWKAIPGYEDYYEISNYGNIRSLDRYVNCRVGQRLSKGKQLKPFSNNSNSGALINICIHGIGIDDILCIKNIVYTTFVGEIPYNRKVVNADGDIFNNNLGNLKTIPYGINENKITMKLHEFENEMRAYWKELFEKGYTKEQVKEMTDALYKKLPFMKKIK